MESSRVNALSARSVLYMPPARVQRKRAQDRINQRASRASGRTRIAELEGEVVRLTLRLARRQKREEALAAAVRQVHQCLRELDADDADMAPSSTLDAHLPPDQSPEHDHPSAPEPHCHPVGTGWQILPPPRPDQVDMPLNLAAGQGTTGWLDDPSFSFYLGKMPGLPLAGTAMPRISPCVSTLQPPLMRGPANVDLGPAAFSPPSVSRAQWSTPILHTPPCCLYDLLVFELSDRVLNQVNPVQSLDLLRPSFPSVKSLLNPSSEAYDNPIASAIGRHGQTALFTTSLPETLAILYHLGYLIRWQLCPTEQNWEAMPSYLRPTPMQQSIKHPAWVDSIGWPAVRNLVLQHWDFSDASTLQADFLRFRQGWASFLVNWSFGNGAIFAQSQGGELQLSEAFREHIHDLRNWTVDTNWTGDFAYLNHAIPKKVTSLYASGAID